MIFRIHNLNVHRLIEMISTLGDKVVKSNYYHDIDCVDVDIDPSIVILNYYHDIDCVDVDIDPSIVILKINDGNLTVDRGGVLFTILHNDYERIEII